MRIFGAAILLGIASLPLGARQISVRLEPSRTSIEFILGAFLHSVHGSFQLERGELRVDTATGAASGEIDVNAASGKSGNERRDRRMRGEILETGKYPQIRFFPSRVTGTIAPRGVSRIEIEGKFEIHGAAHDLTIPVEVRMSESEVQASSRFVIPYVDWGIKNPSTLLLRVEDRVTIEVRASGNLAPDDR